jgi:hypothetical protein
MNARDIEFAQLDRCVAVARGKGLDPENQREANVFALASRILTHFPGEAENLLRASERYFALAQHSEERMDSEDILRKGWVQGLPRFREMLTRLLTGFRPW